MHFPASNNAAEYEACLHGLWLAVELDIKRIYVYGDSTLVINQLNKDWDTTSDKMESYCKEIRKIEEKFYGIEYTHVVRDKNRKADKLSKIGSSRTKAPPGIFTHDLMIPSITEDARTSDAKTTGQNKVASVSHAASSAPSPTTDHDDWHTPLVRYLTDGTGYTDWSDNERLIRRTKQ